MKYKLSSGIIKKIIILTLILLLFFILSGIVYFTFFYTTSNKKIYSEKVYYNVVNNSKVIISPYPTREPSINDYMFSKYEYASIEKDSKFITYVKNNIVYLKNISNNDKLGEEVLLSKNLPKIEDYFITKDKKYLIYSYATGDITNFNKFELGGTAHVVDIKNLLTGETKNILSYDKNKGKILTLTLSPVANIIFIGTDLYRLYYYDIDSSKLVDITYKNDPPKQTYEGFCVGYKVFDQSPNLNYLLLKEICYEGTVHYLYNLNTQERISGKYAYANGQYFYKFLDNGSFLAYDAKDGETIFVGKYNLQNQLVQELPESEIKSADPNQIGIFYLRHSLNELDKYFLTSEKEIVSLKGDTEMLTKNQKHIGDNISLIKVSN